MNTRDIRQEEFAYEFIKANKSGILYLCPRFGKTRTAAKVLQKINAKKVLIAYPESNIEKGWKEELNSNLDVTYTTFKSLFKYTSNIYDLVIIDEVHLLSDNQMNFVKLIKVRNRILGLTGTMSLSTKLNLQSIGLPVIKYYSILQAIEEKIIKDYSITVHMVSLDDKVKCFSKNRTEKKYHDALSYVIDNNPSQMILRAKRLRVIQNSIAKINKTKDLLIPGEKTLVICGNTNTADKICNSYHLKNKKINNLEKFINNEIDHLSIVKLAKTGVTYPKLNRVVINYFDSNSENLTQAINRAMNLDYDNPDQIAQISIVCSESITEQKWLNKSLEFFEESKIKYDV